MRIRLELCPGRRATESANAIPGPLYAAARLMQANARIAEALANVAQVERRRRSIHERIQAPDPKQAELNSHLQKEKITAEERLKIWKRMNEHIEESMRARMGRGGRGRQRGQTHSRRGEKPCAPAGRGRP